MTLFRASVRAAVSVDNNDDALILLSSIPLRVIRSELMAAHAGSEWHLRDDLWFDHTSLLLRLHV